MGQDVVHLPGDAGPLAAPGLLVAQLLLALGTVGAIAQRRHEIPPGADVRAGGDAEPHADQVDERVGPQRVQALVLEAADDGDDQRPRCGDQQRPVPAPHGEGVQPGSKHDGDAGHQHHRAADDGDGDRRSTAPPQGDDADRRRGDLDRDRRPVLVLPAEHDRQHADQRQRHERQVRGARADALPP